MRRKYRNINMPEELAKAFAKIESEKALQNNVSKTYIPLFKVKTNNDSYIKILSETPDTCIRSLHYDRQSNLYELELRGGNNKILKRNLEEFFGLVCIGEEERQELEAIAKMISPYISKQILNKPF